MNIISPIQRLARRIRRLRLEAAEADLLFLEARAPVVIAEQRAHIERLRRNLRDYTEAEMTAAAIARRISQAEKRGVML